MARDGKSVFYFMEAEDLKKVQDMFRPKVVRKRSNEW